MYCSIGGDDAIKFSILTFFDEVLPILGLWCHQFPYLSQGLPFFLGTIQISRLRVSVSRNNTYSLIVPKSRIFGLDDMGGQPTQECFLDGWWQEVKSLPDQ